MPSHIAITGATGFIGAALVEELLAQGTRVTALLRPGSNPARLATHPGCEVLICPRLSDPTTVAALRERAPVTFVHCAWRGVGGHERNEAFQIAENVPLTLEAVELAAASGCRQWIGLGSQAEYGNQNRRLSETDPLLPTTLYGRAKLAAGVAALALCDAHRLAGAWLRVFSTYGPGDAPHWFVPYVIREFLAGRSPRLTRCEQLWDYLFVGDAARAIATTANGVTRGVYNLGSGLARPIRDYVEAIRTELGTTVEPDYGALPYRPDQVMHLEADISRIVGSVGWRPQVSFAEGIRATVAFERNRQLPGPASNP